MERTIIMPLIIHAITELEGERERESEREGEGRERRSRGGSESPPCNYSIRTK